MLLPCFHRVSRQVSHLHFACSPGGDAQKGGGGVSHPIGHVETPKNPIACNRGVSLR